MTKSSGARLSLATLVLLCLTVGCAGKSTSLTVSSRQSGQTYQQKFSKAYAGRSPQGDFDVVLVKGAGPDGATGDVWQVMHVRVLWKPMKGVKFDHPTATNATIDWYVMGADGAGANASQPRGLVAYTGAGFVRVHKSGGFATLDIRSATLRPTTREGGMADPIGPARLQGTIVARTGNADQVRDLLARAREASAQANAARLAAARQASSQAPVEQ